MSRSVGHSVVGSERTFRRGQRRAMRDRVAPTQTWRRRRDRREFSVRQAHHKDRVAEMIPVGDGGAVLLVTYSDLRTKWELAS